MKILFVCPEMKGGGAERVTSLIVSELGKRLHEMTLITDMFSSIDYKIHESVKILPLYSSEKQKKRIIKDIFSIYRIHKFLRSNPIDIGVGMMPRSFLWILFASFRTNIKLVASDHAGFSRKLGSKLENFTRKYLYRYADKITILTNTDNELLGERLPQKIIVENPLSTQCLLSVPTKSKIILAAGRLDAWYIKGFDVLIEAWGLICSKYPDWTVQIAGKGSTLSVNILKDLINANNCSNSVKLVGFQEDLSVLLRDSAIFVLCSREEAFGLVLIEAMSQGCACISTDSQGRQREILTENSGLILNLLSKEELSSKLSEIIDNENKREVLSNNAIRIAKKYELTKITDKWEKMFEELSSI